MCTPSPCLRAVAATASSSASGQTRPPATLWVFSSTSTAGRWSTSSSTVDAAADTCSGVRRPPSPGRPMVSKPACTAAPPNSYTMTCECSSASSTSPGRRVQFQRDLVGHRRRRQEQRRFVPEQRRGTVLQARSPTDPRAAARHRRRRRRSPAACRRSDALRCLSEGRSRRRPFCTRSRRGGAVDGIDATYTDRHGSRAARDDDGCP